MLKDVKWSEKRNYSNGGEHEPIEFYLDSLCNSNSFDLLLGYFSSSAINLLSIGFAKFIHSGGKVRMVVNTFLSENDKNAIIEGQNNYENTLIDFTDLSELRKSLDDYGIHFFECISWLIANKKIEIKVIKPKEGNGIAHYKSGIFKDGETSVGFNASCNFTYYGLLENLESLECYVEDEDKRSNDFITTKTKTFEDIFEQRDDNIEYLNPHELESQVLSEFGKIKLEDIILKEKQLLKKPDKKKFKNPNTLKSLNNALNELTKLEISLKLPKFRWDEGPREYQKEAYANWVINNYKGIFAMATGTGKTVTSLNCLLNEYYKTNYYKAVIVVPTIALVKQWKEECLKFNFKNVIEISSQNKWPDKVSFINSASNIMDISFIVIVTYSSFYRNKFQNHFKKLPSETILIADEAHNLGSPKVSKVLLNIHLEKRIGLSATINRKYDESGNEVIKSFFNDKAPFTYSYSMEEAIKNKVLCSYKYLPHIVRLEEDELNEYKLISKKLNKFFNFKTGTYISSSAVEVLLNTRKQIIHKAKNKLQVFTQILKAEFSKRGNVNYTLVYVPEGIEPNYEDLDESIENESEIKLIDEYTRAVSRINSSIIVKQYTAKTKDRERIIKEFKNGEINVLTSMKCLDEGVDIPRSELAIFCSSTGNPRQFIQRRGRVLRTHEDKSFATIHDLVVVPEINSSDANFEMEKRIVLNELQRVVDFSRLAMNKIDTYNALESTLKYYKLNINDLNNNQNG
jgi:superfamily II DNA or RNA helicase